MKRIFGTAKEAREYLVGLGFAAFKKGLVRGEFSTASLKARLSLQVVGKTGQISTGAGWGYVVVVE